eukprot:2448857-Rhodomonas_salina.4
MSSESARQHAPRPLRMASVIPGSSSEKEAEVRRRGSEKRLRAGAPPRSGSGATVGLGPGRSLDADRCDCCSVRRSRCSRVERCLRPGSRAMASTPSLRHPVTRDDLQGRVASESDAPGV